MRTDPTVCCFNPEIIEESEEIILMEEGCLSYPGLFVKIKRPKTIKVKFADHTGEYKTETFDGITARCFLHELDHMNGINFLQRANSIHRKQALKKMKKNQKWLKKARTLDDIPQTVVSEPVNEELVFNTGEN
jgi:peptide deformylase